MIESAPTGSILAMAWDPAFPAVLILGLGLVLAGVSAWSYLVVTKRLSPRRRIGLLALRLLAVAAVCLFLLQPQKEETRQRVHSDRVVSVLVDTSKSMAETDAADQTRRLDEVRGILAASELGQPDPEFGKVLYHSFAEQTVPLTLDDLPALSADGDTTHIHTAIADSVGAVGVDENHVAVFLFSDGHDFEDVPAMRTAQLALSTETPIYPVPVGKRQTVPDISVEIVSFQPYVFIRQEMEIEVAVEYTGGSPRAIRIELLREGETVDSAQVDGIPGSEKTVSFTASETEPGQFEYTVRASALPDERELGNNEAFTFLNVTDARIPVLLIEGELHWDTTFLKRTLASNERIELTSIMTLGRTKPALWTNADDAAAVTLPSTTEDFSRYPLIVVGRSLGTVLPDSSLEALRESIAENGSTLLLSRGNPVDDDSFDDLAPASWGDGASGPVQIADGLRGGGVVPTDLLRQQNQKGSLPPLPIARNMIEPKTLAAVEAVAESTESGDSTPAILHRRFKSGQVLAVSVSGLWRWSLNRSSEPTNNFYDRFWNQLLLNLIARSGIVTSDSPRLLISSANLELGQEAFLTLNPGNDPLPEGEKTLAVYRDETVIGRLSMTPDGQGRWKGSYLPEQPGRYRIALPLADEVVDCRFAVARRDREILEVDPDYAYLGRLAEATGGRLLGPDELANTLESIAAVAAAERNAPPIVERSSLWDRASLFYLLFAVLGTEWFLRRRWGLT